jgi:2,4-dienoyl-CoA reductase-like NADH-dependent reductase (Old Yellow Enzyme family)
VEVAEAVRSVLPEESPLFVRISGTDWAEGGWTLEDSVFLSSRLRESGVDLVDCSSGGLVQDAKISQAKAHVRFFALWNRLGSGSGGKLDSNRKQTGRVVPCQVL